MWALRRSATVLLGLSALAQLSLSFSPPTAKLPGRGTHPLVLRQPLVRLRSQDPEGPEEVSLEELKQRRKDQRDAEFAARSDELDGLRARIQAVAEENNLEVAEKWTPQTMAEMQKDDTVPMTSFMRTILEESESDQDVQLYDDPILEYPFWRQVVEEAKRVEFPSLAKTARTTGLVVASVLASWLVLGLMNTALAFVCSKFFVYYTPPPV